jgi:hypothetical protein
MASLWQLSHKGKEPEVSQSLYPNDLQMCRVSCHLPCFIAFFISYFARHTLFPALSPSYIRTRPARSCSYDVSRSGSNLLLVVNRQHGLHVTSHPHSFSPLCMD